MTQEYAELYFTNSGDLLNGAVNFENYHISYEDGGTQAFASLYQAYRHQINKNGTVGSRVESRKVESPCFKLCNVGLSTMQKIERGFPVKISCANAKIYFQSARLISTSPLDHQKLVVLSDQIKVEEQELELNKSESSGASKQEIELEQLRQELASAKEELVKTKQQLEEATPRKYEMLPYNRAKYIAETQWLNAAVWNYVLGCSSLVPHACFFLAKFKNHTLGANLHWSYKESTGTKRTFYGPSFFVIISIPIIRKGDKTAVKSYMRQLNSLISNMSIASWFNPEKEYTNSQKGISPKFYVYENNRIEEIHDISIAFNRYDYGIYQECGIPRETFDVESRFQQEAVDDTKAKEDTKTEVETSTSAPV